MNSADRVKQTGVVAGAGAYIQLHGGVAEAKHRLFKDGFLYGVVAARKITDIPILLERGAEWLITIGTLEWVSATDIRMNVSSDTTPANGHVKSAGWTFGSDGNATTVTCINSSIRGLAVHRSVEDGLDPLDQLGNGATVGEVAIGRGARAWGGDAISIGRGAGSNVNNAADGAISVGFNALADGQYNIALGYLSKTSGAMQGCAVLGYGNFANHPYSLSFGASDISITVGAYGDVNNWINEERFMKQAVTTDATPVDLAARNINSPGSELLNSESMYCDSGITIFEAYVIGWEPSTSTTKIVKLNWVVKTDMAYISTALLGSVVKSTVAEDAAASTWDVNVTAVGSESCALSVTGQAAKNIIWHAYINSKAMAVY